MSRIIKTTQWVVWVGGVDEHYDSFRAAVNAFDNWKQKGYDDIALEEYATETTITLIVRTSRKEGIAT